MHMDVFTSDKNNYRLIAIVTAISKTNNYAL